MRASVLADGRPATVARTDGGGRRAPRPINNTLQGVLGPVHVWVNDGGEGGVARALVIAGSKLRLYLDLLDLYFNAV